MSEWGTEGMIDPFKEVYDVSILDMIVSKRAEIVNRVISSYFR